MHPPPRPTPHNGASSRSPCGQDHPHFFKTHASPQLDPRTRFGTLFWSEIRFHPDNPHSGGREANVAYPFAITSLSAANRRVFRPPATNADPPPTTWLMPRSWSPISREDSAREAQALSLGDRERLLASGRFACVGWPSRLSGFPLRQPSSRVVGELSSALRLRTGSIRAGRARNHSHGYPPGHDPRPLRGRPRPRLMPSRF